MYPASEITGPLPRPSPSGSPSFTSSPPSLSRAPTIYHTAPSSPAPTFRRTDSPVVSGGMFDHVPPVPPIPAHMRYYPEWDRRGGNHPGSRTPIPAPNDGDGVKIGAENMSNQDMLRLLVAHGCIDLTPCMDSNSFCGGFITGGAFGDIWKGRLRNGICVAVKVWRLSSFPLDGSKPMKRAMREVYYWSRVKHENIHELMGVTLFQGRLGMISPWMDNGNLREYIRKYPYSDRYALCVQIARGVAYLHANNMVHGDIKGPNVLVSEDGVAKLSDFDYAVLSECSLVFTDSSNSRGGTYRWMAPELLNSDGGNTGRNSKTDVYSLGMTMLEATTGAPPYYPEYKEEPQAIIAIAQRKLPHRQSTYFGNTVRANRMWELLQSCWRSQPLDRPTAQEVYESIEDIATMSNEPDGHPHFAPHPVRSPIYAHPVAPVRPGHRFALLHDSDDPDSRCPPPITQDAPMGLGPSRNRSGESPQPSDRWTREVWERHGEQPPLRTESPVPIQDSPQSSARIMQVLDDYDNIC